MKRLCAAVLAAAVLLMAAPGAIAAGGVEVISVDVSAHPEVSVVIAVPAAMVAAEPTAAWAQDRPRDGPCELSEVLSRTSARTIRRF